MNACSYDSHIYNGDDNMDDTIIIVYFLDDTGDDKHFTTGPLLFHHTIVY